MAAELQTPKLRVEQQEGDYVKLVMEPLNEGFGVTVGNALRRVLLSSLPGAAITSVRIDGVDHEFSTVEHMREDVTELLLNLKEVRLRAHADRPARLFLEAAGETEVRAGDVQATADYEIANPALHLARLDNPDASLVIDLNVETGRGYQPAAAAEGLPIGVIPIDALFTPVRRVNYRVANTRVGQDTNFDRLELEVWTDGTIDGEQAIAQAAAILREQLQPLGALGGDEGAGEREAAAASTIAGHDMPIEQLNLSMRAFNCLKRSGLVTVGAILERSSDELMALRNFGEKSYEELRDRLLERGFPAPRGDARRSSREPATAAAVAALAPAQPSASPESEALPATADEADESSELGLGARLSPEERRQLEALRERSEDPPGLAADE